MKRSFLLDVSTSSAHHRCLKRSTAYLRDKITVEDTIDYVAPYLTEHEISQVMRTVGEREQVNVLIQVS